MKDTLTLCGVVIGVSTVMLFGMTPIIIAALIFAGMFIYHLLWEMGIF